MSHSTLSGAVDQHQFYNNQQSVWNRDIVNGSFGRTQFPVIYQPGTAFQHSPQNSYLQQQQQPNGLQFNPSQELLKDDDSRRIEQMQQQRNMLMYQQLQQRLLAQQQQLQQPLQQFQLQLQPPLPPQPQPQQAPQPQEQMVIEPGEADI
jgi:hypothetical protein